LAALDDAESLACLFVGGLVVALRVLMGWKMMPSCLLGCLWMERNYQSFKDREKMLAELKSFFFDTLYILTAAFVAPLVLNFHDFLF
jgi:heme O synthase-like polyprenyltransferase